MALKHVKSYFSQVAYQYMEMTKTLESFERGLQEGKIEEWQVERARAILKPLKENYDRLAYIIYLLGLPNDDKNRKNREASMIELNNYFDKMGANQKHVSLENLDALKSLKEFLRENGYENVR